MLVLLKENAMLNARRKFSLKRNTFNACATRRRIALKNTHHKISERRRAFNLLVEIESSSD